VPPSVKRTHRGRLLALVAVGLLALGGVLAVASRWATPSHKTYSCPPACGHPPMVVPVSDRPLYVSGDKSYSVRYDASQGSITSRTGSDGVTETWRGLDGGVIRLFGMPASGRTAQQVAGAVIDKAYPDAHRAYQVPNAIVGFQPGYGEVDNVYPQSGGGTASHDILIVMVAVKHDVALVGEAFGPYHPSAPGDENDDGHPTGASLEIALLLDPLINSFTWQGDPVR
jgi:hypothetical protein